MLCKQEGSRARRGTTPKVRPCSNPDVMSSAVPYPSSFPTDPAADGWTLETTKDDLELTRFVYRKGSTVMQLTKNRHAGYALRGWTRFENDVVIAQAGIG